MAILAIIILIGSVILHEVAHGYVADMEGDPTARLEGRLTLNPVSHIDPVGSILVPLLSYFGGGFVFGWAKPVPYNPYNFRNQRFGTFLVAVAGVAVNFFLALLFGLCIRFGIGALSPSTVAVMSVVVYVNLLLGIFNLIPVPPLDGSKVLFALLPPSLYTVEEALERYGLLLMLFVLFFLWRLVAPLIVSLFLLITGIPLPL